MGLLPGSPDWPHSVRRLYAYYWFETVITVWHSEHISFVSEKKRHMYLRCK